MRTHQAALSWPVLAGEARRMGVMRGWHTWTAQATLLRAGRGRSRLVIAWEREAEDYAEIPRGKIAFDRSLCGRRTWTAQVVTAPCGRGGAFCAEVVREQDQSGDDPGAGCSE